MRRQGSQSARLNPPDGFARPAAVPNAASSMAASHDRKRKLELLNAHRFPRRGRVSGQQPTWCRERPADARCAKLTVQRVCIGVPALRPCPLVAETGSSCRGPHRLQKSSLNCCMSARFRVGIATLDTKWQCTSLSIPGTSGKNCRDIALGGLQNTGRASQSGHGAAESIFRGLTDDHSS